MDNQKSVIRFATSLADKFVTKKSLSTNKAAAVCNNLIKNEVKIRRGEDTKI